jgi:hypothetical protein
MVLPAEHEEGSREDAREAWSEKDQVRGRSDH